MLRKLSSIAAATAMTVTISSCALVQSRAEVSPIDQQFMLTAASVGEAEIELGKLAVRQSDDAAVRQYGQHMIGEHTRINGELTTLAKAKNVVLLKAMDPANHTLYSELSKLSGPAFDRQYLLAQLHIHHTGNGLYGSEADNGLDPDVRKFAAVGVPIGVAHLRRAEAILKK
jgi:putative membrane protein